MDYIKGVVGFAEDILAMQEELFYLRNEVSRLKEVERKYNELLDSSMRVSQTLVAQRLDLLCNSGKFTKI